MLWPSDCFAQMLQLDGDAGAKRLLAVHADRVRKVDLGTDAIFADIDTPAALAELRGTRTGVIPLPIPIAKAAPAARDLTRG